VGFDYHIVKPANVAALRGLILNPTRVPSAPHGLE
jgi:hypothetical protein